MLTVGVDLAADEAKTAVASIVWEAGHARVGDVVVGVNDDRIVATISKADKAGIDCPLGWPAPFVEFVAAHQGGRFVAPQHIGGKDWRRQLAYRRTDLAIHEASGLWPLSVAADRIAHPAMRCAGLLARMSADGRPVDRSGAGVVVEVYPAVSLKQWQLPHRGYKGAPNAEQLQRLVDGLLAAAPWLALGEHEAVCRKSDHAIDAVLAGLTARAAALGLTDRPPEDDVEVAAVEGWIARPTRNLAALVSAAENAAWPTDA